MAQIMVSALLSGCPSHKTLPPQEQARAPLPKLRIQERKPSGPPNSKVRKESSKNLFILFILGGGGGGGGWW